MALNASISFNLTSSELNSAISLLRAHANHAAPSMASPPLRPAPILTRRRVTSPSLTRAVPQTRLHYAPHLSNVADCLLSWGPGGHHLWHCDDASSLSLIAFLHTTDRAQACEFLASFGLLVTAAPSADGARTVISFVRPSAEMDDRGSVTGAIVAAGSSEVPLPPASVVASLANWRGGSTSMIALASGKEILAVDLAHPNDSAMVRRGKG